MSEATLELFEKFGFEIETKEIHQGEILRSHLVLTPFSFFNGDPIRVCVVEYEKSLLFTDFGCVGDVLKKTGLLEGPEIKEEFLSLLDERGAFFGEIHKGVDSEVAGFFTDKDFKEDFVEFSRLLMRIATWIEVTASVKEGENHG